MAIRRLELQAEISQSIQADGELKRPGYSKIIKNNEKEQSLLCTRDSQGYTM
jgi:hypothetical protein